MAQPLVRPKSGKLWPPNNFGKSCTNRVHNDTICSSNSSSSSGGSGVLRDRNPSVTRPNVVRFAMFFQILKLEIILAHDFSFSKKPNFFPNLIWRSLLHLEFPNVCPKMKSLLVTEIESNTFAYIFRKNVDIFWLFLVFYSSLSTKSSRRRMNSCCGRNAWGRRRFGTNDWRGRLRAHLIIRGKQWQCTKHVPPTHSRSHFLI